MLPGSSPVSPTEKRQDKMLKDIAKAKGPELIFHALTCKPENQA
jgi:hypothetical protein